jgi:hypothetical protein
MSDEHGRELVRVVCRRKVHRLMTLVATRGGRLEVQIDHHPLLTFDSGPRSAGFDVGVWAKTEFDDTSSGPAVTVSFDEVRNCPANCQCAQHRVSGTRLQEALRNLRRRIVSDPEL